MAIASAPVRSAPQAGLRFRELLDRERFLGPAFVTPALLLILILVAYPFFMALYFAMSDMFIGRPSTFIGIRNFVSLWQADSFRQTFQNAFVFTGTAVLFKLVMGMALALLLNEQLWFKRMIRGAVLLPWVIPTALSTLGWWWMFNSLYSVVNWTGIALGIMDPPGPNWLGQKYYAMTAVVIVNVWRGLPFFAITILAGLVSIPKELYEAAEADGAGPVARFWHVTLPLLGPVLAIVILFSTIFTFSDFNIVYVLTHGGPINSTHLFATLARQIGLESGQIGQGAAISLFLFPLLAGLIALVIRRLRQLRRARATGGAGARLHGRLVTIFSGIAAIPVVLTAGAAGVLMNLAMEAWFNAPIQSVVASSVAVTRTYFDEHSEKLKKEIGFAAANLNELTMLDFATARFQKYVEAIADRLNAEVKVFTRRGQEIASAGGGLRPASPPGPSSAGSSAGSTAPASASTSEPVATPVESG